MIWWFLAGFIAGAVGWNTFVKWMYARIKRREMMEAFKDNK